MTQIAEIIKYEGGNDVFVWKHPKEDFNSLTQLIVHETQEALFFMNGQALDLFGPGRHTLDTQNIPLISKYFNRATGDKTPFHCEVYFINKVEQMAIKWGTDSHIEYLEPTYQFPIQIGVSGEMSLKVENSRKLLIKVVGTEHGITQQGLVAKFRAFLMTRIKTYLANIIVAQSINIFRIDEHLTQMSDTLLKMLATDYIDYGLRLERFFVTRVVKPEDDRSYQKFKELHFRKYADVAEAELRQKVGVIEQTTQAQRTVIEAQGKSEKRKLEGYTYQDERGFDVAERVAQNEAIGQISNLGVGLGMISGVGGTIGSSVGGVVKESLGEAFKTGQPAPQSNRTVKSCPKCGQSVSDSAKFCPECGTKLGTLCPNCGEPVPAGAKFCLKCGQKLD